MGWGSQPSESQSVFSSRFRTHWPCRSASTMNEMVCSWNGRASTANPAGWGAAARPSLTASSSNLEMLVDVLYFDIEIAGFRLAACHSNTCLK